MSPTTFACHQTRLCREGCIPTFSIGCIGLRMEVATCGDIEKKSKAMESIFPLGERLSQEQRVKWNPCRDFDLVPPAQHFCKAE